MASVRYLVLPVQHSWSVALAVASSAPTSVQTVSRPKQNSFTEYFPRSTQPSEMLTMDLLPTPGRHLYNSDSEQERAVQGVPKLQQASSSSHLQSLKSRWQRVSSVGQVIRSSWSLYKRVLLPHPQQHLQNSPRACREGAPHWLKISKAAHRGTDSMSKEEGRLPGCRTSRVFYDKTASCKPEKHWASHPGA